MLKIIFAKYFKRKRKLYRRNERAIREVAQRARRKAGGVCVVGRGEEE